VIYCSNCGIEIEPNVKKFCVSCGCSIIKNSGKSEESSHTKIIKSLSHPLLLLIIGAVISSILIPQLTNKWQVNEKELDIKFELSEQIRNFVANFTTDLTKVAYDAGNTGKITNISNETRKQLFQKYSNTWRKECRSIEITLNMYYPEKRNIPEEWFILCNRDLLNFYIVTINGIDGIDGIEKRYLDELMDRLDNPLNSFELDSITAGGRLYYGSWLAIREAVIDKYQNLIKQIIDAPIAAYS